MRPTSWAPISNVIVFKKNTFSKSVKASGQTTPSSHDIDAESIGER
jgi:hypothetical protein